jgi:rfaE bifunctional protein kinase chain/domain
MNIGELLESFREKKIAIVGDVMVDRYLWGTVTRISPEAPVPVVSSIEKEHRMGGAANVAINIKSLGAVPIICTVVGVDDTSLIFSDLMKKMQMSEVGLLGSATRKTTVKTRVIGNHQQLCRIDDETTDFLSNDLEDQLIGKILNIFENQVIDAVIYQDYDKGVLTQRVIQDITRIAKQKNIPVLVDPKRRSFNLYSNVTLFKPNFKEMNEGLGLNLQKTDKQEIELAAHRLMQEMNLENIMITLSEKGIFVHDGKSSQTFPAEERDITDVSGAGDTVISITALCMACGLDAFAAARLANIAGGLVCEKIGVVPITAEMMMRENIQF